MGDIFFFIKMLIFSFILILVLQVKIGEKTLEEKSMDYISQSSVLPVMQGVADGGVKVIGKVWNNTMKIFGGKITGIFNTDNIPGKRTLGIKMERSKKYLAEKVKEAENKIKQTEEVYSSDDEMVDIEIVE